MSSRPSSRASTNYRPVSSLSVHAPLTPHGKSALADSRRLGGLSAKQVEKVRLSVSSSYSARFTSSNIDLFDHRKRAQVNETTARCYIGGARARGCKRFRQGKGKSQRCARASCCLRQPWNTSPHSCTEWRFPRVRQLCRRAA